MVTDFDDKTLAPTKILKHKNVHIYVSLITLLSEQTLSTWHEWLQPKGIENISSKWKPAWSEGANRTSQTGGMVITAFLLLPNSLNSSDKVK